MSFDNDDYHYSQTTYETLINMRFTRTFRIDQLLKSTMVGSVLRIYEIRYAL